MFQLREYTSAQFPAEIACQVASFIRIHWLTHLRGEDRFWDLFPLETDVNHFVFAERGVLISHALVRQRTITHRGQSYKLYGIGSVMTYPAFRGEGYGRQVVDAATAYILKSDADIGMLFCAPEMAGFYVKRGWTVMNQPGVLHGDPDQPELDTGAFVMMLFVSERGKANRADFEQGPIYIGEWMW